MIFSPAQLADVPAIMEIERGAFPLAEQWGEQSWRGELEAGDRHVLAGRDAHGRVMAAATFQCVADVADLHRIMVAREHRGEGAATQLVRAGMQWARALDAQRMLLEVREDNEAAIALYEACGFATIARRDNYYAPGVHALVMAAPLADEEGASHG